jgi:putative membrane protein insertion efficiency factor
MGHRHSSTSFHEAGRFCLDRSGVAGPAAKPSPLAPVSPGTAPIGRFAAWLLLAAIRFYQAVFAPVMPVGCKFYPSCSRYAAEAIARHGALQGARLAAARLWRCRPFTQGGYDPVPDPEEHLSGEVRS